MKRLALLGLLLAACGPAPILPDAGHDAVISAQPQQGGGAGMGYSGTSDATDNVPRATDPRCAVATCVTASPTPDHREVSDPMLDMHHQMQNEHQRMQETISPERE